MRRLLATIIIIAAFAVSTAPGCAEGVSEEERNVSSNDSGANSGQNGNQGGNQSTNQSGNQSTNQSGNPSTNQSGNQSTNQNTNQENDESVCDNIHCESGFVCDPSGPECVTCLDDGDCPGDEICDVAGDQCVRCLADGDCPGDSVCNTAENACVGCVTDADCGEQVCDEDTCVACVDENDCNQGLVCDPDGPVCVECIDENNCDGDDVCSADGVCVECTTDGDCPDVCDDQDGICVECLEDEDCDGNRVCDNDEPICVGCNDEDDCDEELVCDVDGGQTCLECLDDSHCGEGECDTDFGACVTPCCEFASEPFGEERSVAFGSFDLVAAEGGPPIVAMADSDADEVIAATRSGGDWFYETLEVVNGDGFIETTPFVAADLDASGELHVVMSNMRKLRYYEPTGSGWDLHIIDEFDSAGFFNRVGLVIDSQGTSHIVTEDGPDDGQFHYYRRSSTGTVTADVINTGVEDNVRFIDMEVTDDDEIVFVTSNYSQTPVYVFTRSTSGVWSSEPVGTVTSNGPSIAIDDDGTWWVSVSGDGHPELWEKTGSGWVGEDVVGTADNTGTRPQLDFDETNQPIIAHSGYDTNAGERRLYFTRREGGQWIDYDIGPLGSQPFPHHVYDEQLRRPHIVTRNGSESRMDYYTFTE